MTVKQKIQNLFFPLGSIQKIRTGYLKGYRILLTENSLWSPLIGKFEPAMQKIMVNLIRPGQVVYDIGANNGLHGLLMAGLVGQKGMVYNFEPLEENVVEIDKNFATNHITHYRNVTAAVSGRDGTETFVLAGHHKQGSISQEAGEGAKKVVVKSITLDTFIREGNPGPAFIKMDIEGAEGAALNGFANTIQQYHPIMVIELHTPEQDLEVGKFLQAHKYKAYRFDAYAKLFFTEVRDYTKPYPSPEGIWGSILCLPAGMSLIDLTFSK